MDNLVVVFLLAVLFAPVMWKIWFASSASEGDGAEIRTSEAVHLADDHPAGNGIILAVLGTVIFSCLAVAGAGTLLSASAAKEGADMRGVAAVALPMGLLSILFGAWAVGRLFK